MSEPIATFQVAGTPAPQGSKKHVGRGIMVESSKKLPAWRATLKTHLTQEWAGNAPLDTPLEVTATFYMPRPKRPRFPKPAVHPDTDKLCRDLGDSLEQSGVVANDSRITTWHASKKYHRDGWTGVRIRIQEDKQ